MKRQPQPVRQETSHELIASLGQLSPVERARVLREAAELAERDRKAAASLAGLVGAAGELEAICREVVEVLGGPAARGDAA